MRLNNKIKQNKGSAMVFAIILMFLVSMGIMLFSSQINNVIRMNSRSYRDMQAKYTLEAGMENVIGQVCVQIEEKLGNILKTSDIRLHPPTNTQKESDIILNPMDIEIKSLDINEMNYRLKEDVKIVLNINAEKYMTIDEDGKMAEPSYRVIKNIDEYVGDISVSTELDGKEYELNSEIKFMVKDISKNQSGYDVISWNK
ncbi:hypothetical protein [Romboutsia sp.]|uniref:hypothetical protein n=1 Tax=Romboutsia sp. TaxID=1965302 RepID=UPI003F300A55